MQKWKQILCFCVIDVDTERKKERGERRTDTETWRTLQLDDSSEQTSEKINTVQASKGQEESG